MTRLHNHSLLSYLRSTRAESLALVYVLAIVFLFAPLPAGGSRSPAPDNRSAYTRAIAPNSTRADVDEWLATLPVVRGLYVIEGDLLYTEQQARGYISAQKSLNDPSSRLSTQELLLNQRPDGLPDYYADPKDRVLTYTIDRSSFGEEHYRTVVTNFGQAASQWMALCEKCSIQFVHDTDEDAHPNGKSNFVVKYDAKLPKGTIALSFFPSDPSKRREVHVAPLYFTDDTYDSIGVFRHELGHVLGYRHEHIRNSGCAQDASSNSWIAITPYDSHSVMHYPCGGGGSTDFQFSQCDISGHLLVYGPIGPPKNEQDNLEGCEATSTARPLFATGTTNLLLGAAVTSASTTTDAALSVNFEGGVVAQNIFEVLRILRRSHVLPVTDYEVQAGDSPDTVYRRLLGAPQGSSDALIKLFTDLNPKVTRSQLAPGQSIKVPDTKLTQYEFAVTYNPDSTRQKALQKQHESSWRDILVSTDSTDSGDLSRFTGYRLVIYGTPKAMKAATQRLTATFPGSRNVLIMGPGQELSQKYSVPGFPKALVQQLDGNKSLAIGVEGDLSSIFGADAPQPQCNSRNVDIFLLDGEVEGHPDLVGALAFNVGIAQLPELAGRKQTQERIFADRDHATHMAGILVAQANGFGIIGLAPCSTLHPYNWQAAYDSAENRANLTFRMINERLYNETISSLSTPIVVMATDWPDTETKASMTSYIRHENGVLWVVAAGDRRLQDPKADENSQGVPIDDQSPGPMNLGGEENVVVVTACMACDVEALRGSNSHPSLASWANFSAPGSKTVRMAAPGEPILSTVKDGQYATAFGTSQASAMVGGIAAAMVARFPTYYRRAAQIKYWLELTALPFGSGDDLRVAAGIVNPDAALRDPRNEYFATTTSGLQEAHRVEWCGKDIELKNHARAETQYSAVNEQVARLIYSPSSGMWTVFTRGLPNDITPMVSKEPSGYIDSGPIVKIDGVVYTSETLRDLILPTPLGEMTSCIQRIPAGIK